MLHNQIENNEFMKSGVNYFQEGKFELAIDEFTKAINLQPEQASPCIYRGFTWLRLNESYKGFSDFQEAYKKQYKAYHLIHISKISLFEYVIKKWFETGLLEIKVEPADISKAIDDLSWGERFSDMPVLYKHCLDRKTLLGQLMAEEKQFIKSIKGELILFKYSENTHELGLSMKVTHPEYADKLSSIHYDCAQDFLALEMYDDAFKFFGYVSTKNNSGISYFQRGKILAIKGDFENAIKEYDKALTFSSFLDMYEHRADAYQHLGKCGKAIVDYRDAFGGWRNEEIKNKLKNLFLNLKAADDLGKLTIPVLFTVLTRILKNDGFVFLNQCLYEGNPLGDFIWKEVSAWDRKFNFAYNMEKYTLNKICKYLQENDPAFVWPVKMISVTKNTVFETDSSKPNVLTFIEENVDEKEFIKKEKLRPYTFHCEL